MKDRSALTDELKLGEDNSDRIQVHPELNSVSSLRPSVCVLATEKFPQSSVASARVHLLLLSLILTEPFNADECSVWHTKLVKTMQFIQNYNG